MNRAALLLSTVTAFALPACSEEAVDADSGTAARSQDDSERLVTPITKAETIDVGLAVGEKAPVTASMLNSEGETSFDKLLEDGPALVVFTRSVEWCPYCQTQLKSINAIVGDLQDRGYTLYGLSYDSPAAQDRFSKNQMLQYDMLSDQSSAVIDAFGLRDPEYTEGRAAGVPYASVFVVDPNGTITAKSVSGDYKQRPTNDQILALVDAI